MLIDRYLIFFVICLLLGGNHKEDSDVFLIYYSIDRFDGRALLDFIRDTSSHRIRASQKSEEEQELEEFVNFERYRDLIKHRRRGCRYFFYSFNHPFSFKQSKDGLCPFFHSTLCFCGSSQAMRS